MPESRYCISVDVGRDGENVAVVTHGELCELFTLRDSSDAMRLCLQLASGVNSSKANQTTRFDILRAEGKTLGEINQILEAEGFEEVSGAGVMPCPTQHHRIINNGKGARRMIEKGELR